MDKDLLSTTVGEENFFEQAEQWKPDGKAALRERGAQIAEGLKGRRSAARGRR